MVHRFSIVYNDNITKAVNPNIFKRENWLTIVLGFSSILAGYWFLKLNIKGFYLVISAALVNIISDALSWDLWDSAVEKMVYARKKLQGLPVREGEVAFMQSLFPEGMLLSACLVIIAVLFTYRRFVND